MHSPVGYEVKGLAYPGREATYDANSQMPTGFHNGRAIYYVFGRYPKDPDGDEYPVIDLVLFHGDFLNANHDYVHENKHITGFGSYGDVMIRDRKMYVAPTPFALLDGAAGQHTLIMPADAEMDMRLQSFGELVRIETDQLLVGYDADLRENTLSPPVYRQPVGWCGASLCRPPPIRDKRSSGYNESCVLTVCTRRRRARFLTSDYLMQLHLEQLSQAEEPGKVWQSAPRAIECDDFPFEQISRIAERESWRKEIYRPIYHIHKWWAQRLGSVFRGILLGALMPKGTDVLDLFYSPARFPDTVVFDPFMGSGTTLGETLKLGGQAIGRDINPVSYLQVRTALTLRASEDLERTYREIEADVGETISSYYTTSLPDGTLCRVLYYFWVMQAPCPVCSISVDLFSNFIFAKHANTRLNPTVHVVCPNCDAISPENYQVRQMECSKCSYRFDPTSGPVRGKAATCPHCLCEFTIGRTIRETGSSPSYRMYAKLLLTPDGRKEYHQDHKL